MKILVTYRKPILFLSILIILLISIFGKGKSIEQPEGFTDLSGCSLNCSDPTVMLAMKKEFESNYLEGFQGMKEGFQSFFSNPLSQLQSQITPEIQTQLLTNLLSSTTGLPPSLLSSISSVTAATAATAATAKVVKKVSNFTLRTVTRAYQLSPLKCEYEITYDKRELDLKGVSTDLKDQFGYFQATFTKNAGAECAFTPTEVRLLIGPEISKIDSQGKTEEIPLLKHTF
jgi:hypothetical protein